MTADDRVTLTTAWPLFGLRIRSERLVLRLPTDDDLVELMAVAKAGIHPPGEMGFGREMRAAVLAFAFDALGAQIALTEAFLDNAASNGVSRSLGYEENGRGALAPEGVARETQRFRMTVERWQARPWPPIEIQGLDPCLAMFGVEP